MFGWINLLWILLIPAVLMIFGAYVLIVERHDHPLCDTVEDINGTEVYVEVCDHPLCQQYHKRALNSGLCHGEEILFCRNKRHGK